MSVLHKTFLGLLKHPLFITIITFIFTGILASNYQQYLEQHTKNRDLENARREKASDLETTRREKAAESVKVVTDLLYERVFKGSMVVSSLKRHAPIDELKDRKKTYDDVFVRYNAEIQSNMFRIREMFGAKDYTSFEGLMEGELRDALAAQDECITHAYDDAINGKLECNDLDHCKIGGKVDSNSELSDYLSITELYKSLVDCEYNFTNTLFMTVEGAIDDSQITRRLDSVRDNCTLRNNIGRAVSLPSSSNNEAPHSEKVIPKAPLTDSWRGFP